ncbi:hypothetical protein BDV23DRAFT_59072 [Aspergillus alliaceus]|uniref:Secreted protein n=1 Tax=Petromyces alliaceus TaxID=209559 RepID=A0A5N7CCW3_PETAA|nr:hypothetical protein BDV23DRAFT_59072 [Aspergillus alliaceus]
MRGTDRISFHFFLLFPLSSLEHDHEADAVHHHESWDRGCQNRIDVRDLVDESPFTDLIFLSFSQMSRVTSTRSF